MLPIVERFLPPCLLFEKLVGYCEGQHCCEKMEASHVLLTSFRMNLAMQSAFIRRHSDESNATDDSPFYLLLTCWQTDRQTNKLILFHKALLSAVVVKSTINHETDLGLATLM